MQSKFDSKKVINVIGAALYVFMWVLMVFALYMLYLIYLGVVKDAFGTAFVVSWCILGAVVFLSYIWCRIIFKNRKRLKLLLPFALSVLFFVFSIFFNYMGNKQFEEFSTDKWMSYPQQRGTMAFDLMENYDLTGMTVQEFTELLGESDRIAPHGENELYYDYDNRLDNVFSYTFYVVISNGVVENYGYSE